MSGPGIVVAAGVLSLALSSLTACGRDRESAPEPAEDLGPVATYPDFDGSGMFSTLEGPLRNVDGCLVVGGVHDGLIPVFPAEFVAWDEGRHALVSGDEVYVVGELIDLGGGGTGDVPGDDWTVPASCPELEFFLVGEVGLDRD